MSNNWETGICGCFDVKDCGPGCCIKLYCGGPCIWGAAMEKAGVGSCCACCLGIGCTYTTLCVGCYGRKLIAEKYNIQEDACMQILLSLFCGCCSDIQVINQILIKENATWGCCGLDASGAPETEVIER
mmetsp:Transcript_24897/g.50537  ORF Transcript_24897/g.50537 Transcript_24897/m.50537 type:complete len:129 (+) Transcript_24897:54-440(+)|eukprot:CAMPEP_0119061784 /NCGR_PEP_ID=MMETSP1178-20130426/5520_1 /TAXON_ID=33656 /ORGANISM="unid sp, Strain CCMP2000" /LENGTH=128 /DNA_ID=CAMNT_0007043021 /DNA_START=54 /DNA_END=440 /DNA_ORIENTATION=+